MMVLLAGSYQLVLISTKLRTMRKSEEKRNATTLTMAIMKHNWKSAQITTKVEKNNNDKLKDSTKCIGFVYECGLAVKLLLLSMLLLVAWWAQAGACVLCGIVVAVLLFFFRWYQCAWGKEELMWPSLY